MSCSWKWSTLRNQLLWYQDRRLRCAARLVLFSRRSCSIKSAVNKRNVRSSSCNASSNNTSLSSNIWYIVELKKKTTLYQAITVVVCTVRYVCDMCSSGSDVGWRREEVWWFIPRVFCLAINTLWDKDVQNYIMTNLFSHVLLKHKSTLSVGFLLCVWAIISVSRDMFE